MSETAVTMYQLAKKQRDRLAAEGMPNQAARAAAAMKSWAAKMTAEELQAAPPPDKVIAHTNLSWDNESAPGREAGTLDTAEIKFRN